MRTSLVTLAAAFVATAEAKYWNFNGTNWSELLAISDYTSTLFSSILQSIHLHVSPMAKGKPRQGTQSKRKSQQSDRSASASSSVDLNGSLSLRTLAREWRRSTHKRKDSVLEDSQQKGELDTQSRAKELAGQSWTWLQANRNPLPGARNWIVSTRLWRFSKTRIGLHTLIINAIGLCMVFGALKLVLDSLLLATRVSAAYSASASTVYVPYTHTVSAVELSLASSTGSQDLSSSPSYTTISTFTTTVSRTTTVTASETLQLPAEVSVTTATVTATLSLFTTVTASSPPSSPAPRASSSGPAYSFQVSDGSTIWQGGATPSGSASLDIVTMSVVVTPLPTASSAAASGPSLSASLAPEALTTFTPPPYSLTTFSVVSPALTTTLTSTHYITRSLSRVLSSPQSSRASFTGVNSAGWNASSTQDLASTSLVATAPPRFTKFTRMVYFGHDDITTSTSTQLVTVTVGQIGSTSPGDVIVNSLTASSAVPVSSAVSGSLPTRSTQNESPTSNDTPATSSSASLGGIHQTIGVSRSSSSSYTILPVSSVLSTYGLPGVSGASNVSATATAYAITTLLSEQGMTVTVRGPATSSTAVNSATLSATTVSGSRSSANSSSYRATTGASLFSSDLVLTPSSLVDPTSLPIFSRPSPPESGSLSSGSSTSDQPSQTGLSTRAGPSFSSTTARPSQPVDSTIPSSLTDSTSASFITSTRLTTSSVSSRNSTSIVAATLSRSTSATTSAGASAIPTCGEQGDFTMNFDDLPTFHTGSARLRKRQSPSWNSTSTASGNDTSDITQQPPLSMRPYKHMLFSSGYVYAPLPVEPFAPVSAPNVAVFLANGTGLRAGVPPAQNGLEPGEIADGPYHEGNPAFLFNPRSAALGCDSQTTPCTMEVTGYTWNDTVKDDVPTYYENYTLPACERYQNCQLTTVTFPPTFRNLSGIRMRAVRGSEPRTFFVDDIEASWADSSCESGKTRQNSP